MVEGKLYKTRLCLLFQRGRCSRQYCNFAHGDSELRRSFNGRQEYQGRDLRERLGRIRSPASEYSSGRDARARHSSHGDIPVSGGRNIDRNHGKRQQFDGLSDRLRMSDQTEDRIMDRRLTSSDVKMHTDEKLRQMHSEIKMLDNKKRKLENYLEDKVQEEDTLNLKIHELEMQISKEKDESKRISTQIKKFIKAHKRYLRLQDDLKRSHAQLRKLGEQLDLEILGPGNGDDSKMNITADDKTGNLTISPLNEHLSNSPLKKRSRLESPDASNRVNGERSEIGKDRLEKLSRQTGHHDQLTNSKKHEADGNEDNEHGLWAYEDKSRRALNMPSDAPLADKHKVSEPAITVPPTGIAAHVIDDDFEAVKMEEKFRVVGAETELTLKTPGVQFLPPPPPLIPHNVYIQYKGNAENIDTGVPEDAAEVDII